LRSGLALAGANVAKRYSPVDVGLLMAEGVTDLDLLHCDLVVLSACETGLGDVQSEYAFFGDRSVYMPTVPVESRFPVALGAEPPDHLQRPLLGLVGVQADGRQE
jgi:hypothetical protein